MGYRLNRLDEPVLMAVPKPMQTEFGIHHRLESCEYHNFRSMSQLKCLYYTMRLNIYHTALYYSTGKLAPEKVIVVVPLEQVRKEGSRVSFHCGSE